MKSVAILQPYFLPYFGYFQLIKYVDLVILYDNVQYAKKGWINRNKILRNGKIINISIPLKKGSHKLNINERYLSENWYLEKDKILEKIYQSYKNFQNYEDVYMILDSLIKYKELRLDKFLVNSIIKICNYLNIKTKIKLSSDIDSKNYNLRSSDRILNIIKKVNCNKYVNPIGGKILYSKKLFAQNDIKLEFFNSTYYKNNDDTFKRDGKNNPLSIVDLLMRQSIENIKTDFEKFSIE